MKSRAPLSLATILTLFLLMLQVRLWVPNFDTHNVTAILTWDAMGYYLYLPAHFIYHDLLHLAFIPKILQEYNPTGGYYQAFQVHGGPPGDMVMKYPMGLAIMNTPFFWLGHWAAGYWNYARDGFSAPYQVAIALGGVIYALLGLGLLRHVLLRYATDAVVSLTLAMLVLGSNYLHYAAIDGAMAHSSGLTLYALLLWLTVRWHERPGRGWAAAIGLTLGLIVMVRPSDMVAVLLPLLWGVGSREALRSKVALLRSRPVDVIWLVGCGLVGVLPQLLYWKWASGHFFVYSYEDQGFSFLQPHTWQVLFSYRKGWLMYSPLMLLPVLGLVVLWRRNRGLGVPVLVYFLVNLWVVSAWDIWWYGGSFGQRALVQSYAALALPLAYLLTWLGEQRPGRSALRGAALLGSVLCIDQNLVLEWQYMNAILDGDNMNRRFFVALLGNVHPTQDDLNLLESKNRLPGGAKNYTFRQLGKLGFDDQPVSDSTGITDAGGYHSRQAYASAPTRNQSPAVQVRLQDAGLVPGQWVRGSVMVNSEYGAWGQRLMVVLERNGQTVQSETTRLQNALSVPGRWTRVWLDMPIPDDAQPNDLIKVFVLNENGSPSLIDDLQVEGLQHQLGW